MSARKVPSVPAITKIEHMCLEYMYTFLKASSKTNVITENSIALKINNTALKKH